MKLSSIVLFTALAITAVLPGSSASDCTPATLASVNENGYYTREQLAAMYPDFFFYRGASDAKKVALTFDDGPDDKVTPQILDILKENSVKGTFFLIGSYASLHPDVVRRIIGEGHVIGNHTWSHRNLIGLTTGQVCQEIERTEQVLEQLTGRRAALVRSPRGKVSPAIMDLAQKEGWRVIGWSVDSFDWRDDQAAKVLARLRTQIHPGGIILMHSVALPTSKGVTVKVLPALLKELKADGYQIVTVDEMLGIDAYRAQGRAPSITGPRRNTTL